MNVTLHFLGQARLAAGCERVCLALDVPCTPRQALEWAARERGPGLHDFLFGGDGLPRQSLLLVVGQRQVDWDEAEPLRDGDEVTVLPPIAGGQG